MIDKATPKRRKFRFKDTICIYTMCVACAGVLFADAAMAATAQEVPQLNTDFWVRTLLGILLAFIAYYTRGIEKRVELAEHEFKNINSQIGMIRESMYRDYHNKQEIERHWEQVQASLEHISNRLDFMSRPALRRADDEENDNGHARRRPKT
jgi:hypothetical protein